MSRIICISREYGSGGHEVAENRQVDKQRKAYYEYHTGKDWGSPYNYDVCLNSASMGTERIARLIVESFGKITREEKRK